MASIDPTKFAHVVERYLAGESELGLSKSIGIGRTAIRRHLIANGVTPRGRSEAGQTRAARMSADERRAQAAAANAAMRRVPQPEQRLMRSAQTREATRVFTRTSGEIQIEGWLREMGEQVVLEKAEGRYNIDLALAPVAVEVLGGKWHGYKRTHGTRTKTLLDAGWHVVFVWNTELWPVSRTAAHEIHTFAESARRNPAAVREYRVIRGDGQLIATGRVDDYNLTHIPSANSLSRRRRPSQRVT